MASGIFAAHLLKTRIALAMLGIFLLGIGSLSLYVSRMLSEDLQRAVSEQQFATVSTLASQVNTELSSRLQALEINAAGSVEAMQAGPRAMQKRIDERITLQMLFNGGLIAYDLNGTAIADHPLATGRRGTNYLDIDVVAAALKEGRSSIGRPLLGKKLNTPVFGMAAPIRDPQGKVIGALAGVITLSQPTFLSAITDHKYGKTGGYLVIDARNRLIVTATEKQRIMEELPPPGINPLIDRFINGYEGSAVIKNPRGIEVLASDKAIPVAGWIMSATMPTEEAFAPIYALQQRMFLASFVLGVLIAALSWWTLKRQFAPLESSVDKLAAMSDNTQPLKALPVTQNDEIGQLIGGFNDLLETVNSRERSLRERDEALQSILETTLDGFWQVNGDGRLLRVNPAYAKMSGYSQAELIGMHVNQLEAMEQRDETDTRINRLIQVGHDQFETRHRRKDGAIWDLEVSTTYFNKAGGQLFAFLRDISQRKAAEQALRVAERQFRGLVEQSLVGVYIIQAGRWRYVNPRFARIFGYSSAEEVLANTSVSDLIVPEERAKVTENLRRRTSGEIKSISYAFTGLRKDGSAVEVEVFGSSLDFEDSPAVIGVLLDITERRRTEGELAQYRNHLEEIVLDRTRELAEARDIAESANRAKSAFLGNMSHELRTPLNHIMGFSAILARDIDSEQGRARLAKITEASRQLLTLINSILDISRLEAEQISLEEIDFELPRVLEQIERGIRASATQKGLELVHEIAPDMPAVLRGDPVRLAQILSNLLDNALKFSEHGTITLRISAAPAQNRHILLRVEVIDQGIGIPPEQQESLFKLFNQGDASLTRRHGGTGLGLALSKRLVTLMAGEIGFTSPPGAGTTFWFSLPLLIGQVSLPTPGPSGAIDWSRIKEATAYLGKLLAEGNIEAQTLWGKNPDLFAPVLQARMPAFSEAMELFDFETALQLLEEGSLAIPDLPSLH